MVEAKDPPQRGDAPNSGILRMIRGINCYNKAQTRKDAQGFESEIYLALAN